MRDFDRDGHDRNGPEAEPAPRIRRRVVLADGLTLDVAEQGHPPDGRGTGPVVFLPGLSDSWRSVEPILDLLRPDVWAFAVSQRGHGDSDKPATGYTPEDYARDAVGLLDALGVDRAVLVAHSSGSLTVRLVAARSPARVSGAVLVGSPLVLGAGPAAREFAAGVAADLADPVPDEFVREFSAATTAKPLPAASLEVMTAENLKVPARVWRETVATHLEHDDGPDLGRITAPTLLVWGDADVLVSRADQDALLAALPSASLRVYPGAGHSPHLEDPERFAADLLEFVSGLAV